MENSPIKEEEMEGKRSNEESGICEGSEINETRLEVPFPAFWRVHPPTTYSVTFESYAKMADLVKDGYYESLPFTVDGLNWTFIIYPNGDKEEYAEGCVSVYARLDDSNLLTDPQDVYAEIKFFVYSGDRREYLTYHESEPIKFDHVKPKWGVPKFLLTGFFLKGAIYGFIYDGEKCTFGIDVFVAQRNKREVFSYDENIINPVFTWNIANFSTLDLDSYTSEPFSSGDRNWVLKVYPKGDGAGKGNSLSLYLLSESNIEKHYVRATLRVLNQIGSSNVEKQVEGWPNAAENGWGFQEFISLADLQDASTGFVVDDLLQVEVEIMAISKQTPNY